jgi:hypothetical protein
VVYQSQSKPQKTGMRTYMKILEGIAGLAILVFCSAFNTPAFGHASRPDVVVVGATPAGIMAAIAAARLGSEVVILEQTDHVGGIMTNGLTKCDIINKKAIGGLFTEFTQKLHKYYIDKYGLGSPQEMACKEGFESEPHVVELIFNQMLAAEKKVTVQLRHRLKRVVKTGNQVTGVVMEHLDRNHAEVPFSGRVFIDATYEGDVFAFAGADYFIGRESRYEYGERQAGKLYCRFGYDELLPGSTGEGDRAIQAFCFRMNMTNVPENRVPVTKPAVYNRDEYTLLIDDIRSGLLAVKPSSRSATPVQFMPKPNGKFEINSNHASPVLGAPKISLDLPEENWDYPEADYEGRAKIVERYKNYHLGMLWFLQNDPELPEEFRKQMSEFGFSKDEYVNNNHFPRQIYVREARRLHGSYVYTQHEDEIVPGLGRTRIHPTSIAIAEYPWDSHGCSRYDPAHPGVREGYFYVEHKPMQIPYEVMVPKKIDGLLVPVAVSCSHVGQQTLRMEPGFMVYGQAAGIAAHTSIRDNVLVRHVAIRKVQTEIFRQKGVIAYLDNITSSDPDYDAFQYLAARGFNTGYEVNADRQMSKNDALNALQRLSQFSGKKWTKPTLQSEEPLTYKDLAGWIGAAKSTGAGSSETMNVRKFARTVYDSWYNRAN